MKETSNPTALHIGMTGSLCGIHYRVVGRVVVGMEEEGEVYCWNEFHLLDNSGQSATLVYEETDDSPEWKLFMLFDPARPLTAAEAARKRVGDTVNLDGTNARVTLVSKSCVYYVEGQAPEGVETGDIANYFNAETGAQMHVVSWTGDEVECYRGMNLSAADITRAFGITTRAPLKGMAYTDTASPSNNMSGRSIVLVFACVILLIILVSLSHSRTTVPVNVIPKKTITRVSPLTTGAGGTLDAQHMTITGHAVVEIAKVGRIYDWHEYHLRNDDGATSLLLCGLNGSSNQWHLFRPVQPITALTPTQAATLRAGDTLRLEEQALRIRILFQSRVLSSDDQYFSNKVLFGFIACSSNNWSVVRWTQNEIEFYLGAPLTESEVLTAFGIVTR